MRASRLYSSLLRRTPIMAAYRRRDEHAAAPKAVKRLSVVRPDLVGEWVPDMNELDVATVSITATEVVTWRCSSCRHQWTAPVRDRAIGEGGCPECARRASSGIAAINNADSIAHSHPDLATRWDAALNAPLRPSDVSAMSTRAVWWRSVDGKESFRRPVYAFIREQRSHRELHVTQVEERTTALEHLAPLVGYALPESIRRVVDGFKASPPNAEPYLSRTSSGSLTIDEVASFEDMWCADFNAAKRTKSTTLSSSYLNTEVGAEDEDAPSSAAKASPKTFNLTLDTSLNNGARFQQVIPITAMLNYHAEQLVSAVNEAKAFGEGSKAELSSYMLDVDGSREAYTLGESTRARLNAHRMVANRLRFKSQRPMGQPIKAREMPEMPSPAAILESEATGRATIEDLQSQALTDADFKPRSRPRRAGFRRNQSLDMPDEIDETPISLSTVAAPEPVVEAEPVPEVVAPAAPRVVGRRRKSA